MISNITDARLSTASESLLGSCSHFIHQRKRYLTAFSAWNIGHLTRILFKPALPNNPALFNFRAKSLCLSPTKAFLPSFIRRGINSRFAITFSISGALHQSKISAVAVELNHKATIYAKGAKSSGLLSSRNSAGLNVAKPESPVEQAYY
jgi:hypothetical protein